MHCYRKLPEHDLEAIYTYAQFIRMQRKQKNMIPDNELDDIFNHLTGAVKDTGKTLAEYKNERINERYGITD